MTSSNPRNWRLLASGISAGAFLICFVLLPTHSAKMIFGESEFLNGSFVQILSLVLGTLSLFLYSSIPGSDSSERGRAHQKNSRIKRKQFSSAVTILFSVAILGQAIWNLSEPLNVDEYLYTFDYDHSPLFQIINPFNFHSFLKFNQNHTLCNITSYLSTKLFGLSPLSLRLPSIFFTLGLLFVIRWVMRDLTTTVLIALYVQLLSNGLVCLEFASAKGYVSMMLFSFVVFNLARDFTLHPAKISRRKLTGLAISLVLCVETHAFATIFLVVTAMAMALWYFLHRENLRAPVRDSMKVGLRLEWFHSP